MLRKTGFPAHLSDISQLEAPGHRGLWNLANEAIQLAYNTDMNLNVFGDAFYHAGSKTGVYGWNGGKPNETWVFLRADFKVVASASPESAAAVSE